MLVHISVYKSGGRYYATRMYPIPPEGSKMPGEIFSMIEEVSDNTGGIGAFHERAKNKARKLGISHVINLD